MRGEWPREKVRSASSLRFQGGSEGGGEGKRRGEEESYPRRAGQNESSASMYACRESG